METHDENVSETFKRITPPTPENAEKVEMIKRKFTELEKLMKELTPEGRWHSIGITHLETAQMYF